MLTIISILEGIISQIGTLNPNIQKWEESKKKIGGLFKKMAVVGTKVAANAVGIDGDTVCEVFGEGEQSATSDIMQLKEEISKLIADARICLSVSRNIEPVNYPIPLKSTL